MEGAATGGGEQGYANHLPMALGSLLCWPAADTMLSWTPEMLAKTAPCASPGFSLQYRETAQS